MSKKSLTTENIVDALCDGRVINIFFENLQEKITQLIRDQLDNKLKEFVTEIKESVANSTKSQILNTFNELLPATTKLINENKERISNLENFNLQRELIIHGLANTKEERSNELDYVTRRNREIPLADLIRDHIKEDLNIHLEANDINYAYRLKAKAGETIHAPILVNFVTINKRNEILQQARTKRKQRIKSGLAQTKIYYNERLTKENSEIAFKARSLVRQKKILSTWTFKGEPYIKRTPEANPEKITSVADINNLASR